MGVSFPSARNRVNNNISANKTWHVAIDIIIFGLGRSIDSLFVFSMCDSRLCLQQVSRRSEGLFTSIKYNKQLSKNKKTAGRS